MKVMSWNTLYGGRDGTDERRFNLQRQVIGEIAPDILLLQECKGFEADGNKRLYEVEQALGMRGFLAFARSTGQHTAVFIGGDVVPVSFASDSVHFHHAAALATLRVRGFEQPITFVSVHLCPVGVPMRLVEAANLVAHAAPKGLRLVAGDFNSLSPLDEEPDWTGLPQHFKARYTGPDGVRADRRVLETLYSAGFIDIGHAQGGNSTSTVPGAAFSDAEFVPFRADYFLASQALGCLARSYSVIRDARTDEASDHYPIVAEFASQEGRV